MVAGVNSSTSTVGVGALCAWASALALLDALDELEPNLLGEGPQGELELDLFGDDVVPGTPVNRAHGDHGRLDRLDLAADDRLEIEDGERRQDDRIDGAVRPGAVAAFPANGHRERGRAGQERASTVEDNVGWLIRAAVQRKGEVRLGEAAVQTIGEHLASPADGFLGRLGDHHDRAAPAVLMLCEPPRRADEAGHVHVVATGVHHADLTALRVPGLDLARVGKPCLLDDRECVHIGADQHHRPRPVLDQAHHAELAYAGRDFRPGPLQLGRHPSGGLHFLVRQFRMGMQMNVQPQKLVSMGGVPGIGRAGRCNLWLGLVLWGTLPRRKEKKNGCESA